MKRSLAFLSLFVSAFLGCVLGCGNKIIYVIADLGVPVHDDFAKPVIADLATPPPPEDLHISLPLDLFQECTPPTPGYYLDYNMVSYVSVANPNPTVAYNSSAVIVRNDGTYVRPNDNMTVPSIFHCVTPPVVDQKSCLALCCSGDPTIVPQIYYAAAGWHLFKAGVCTIKDPSSAVIYTVQFDSVTGSKQ